MADRPRRDLTLDLGGMVGTFAVVTGLACGVALVAGNAMVEFLAVAL